MYGSQVEITESVAPVTVWCRELICDSGGVGEYRGGLGQRIEISSSIDEPFMVFLSVERIDNPAKGRAGGQPGRAGRIRVRHRDDEIADKELPGKGEQRISPGETLIFETPGGGGYGKPENRASTARENDVTAGWISSSHRGLKS